MTAPTPNCCAAVASGSKAGAMAEAKARLAELGMTTRWVTNFPP